MAAISLGRMKSESQLSVLRRYSVLDGPNGKAILVADEELTEQDMVAVGDRFGVELDRIAQNVRWLGLTLFVGLLASGLTVGGMFVLSRDLATWRGFPVLGLAALLVAGALFGGALTFYAGGARMDSRLTGLDGVPMLYFLETCDDTIRTIPLLQHDQRNAEDLDTEGEDHAGDETRYACMSRPWVLDAVTERGISFPKLPGQLTFNDVLQMNRRKRLESQGELW